MKKLSAIFTILIVATSALAFDESAFAVAAVIAQQSPITDSEQIQELMVLKVAGVSNSAVNNAITDVVQESNVDVDSVTSIGLGIQQISLDKAISVDNAEDLAQNLEDEPAIRLAAINEQIHVDPIPYSSLLDGSQRSVDSKSSKPQPASELENIASANPLASVLTTTIDPTSEVGSDVAVQNSLMAPQLQTNATWGLDRIDQTSLPLNGSYRSDFQGAGVNVYIVDSGITASHRDFGGRVQGGYAAFNDWCGTGDTGGHGTHVAATAAGRQYGVAKNANVIPVRVFDCAGNGDAASVISGINWVISHHQSGVPAVANFSVGLSYNTLVNYAVERLISDGVTAVVASGNEGDYACGYSPASVTSAITVNASTSWDDDSIWSNFGACTDIYAPGESITSAWNTSTYSTKTISGTSMATPHVTGAAALVLSANPSYTPSQVWSTLSGLATNVNFIPSYSADAKKLLRIPSGILLSSVPSIRGYTEPGSTLSVDLGSWDPGITFAYRWYQNGVQISGALASTYVVQPGNVGQAITVQVTGTTSTGISLSKTSSAIYPASGNLTLSPVPTISGFPRIGQVLTATPGTWDSGVSLTYQWLRGSTSISGATSATYTVADADLGNEISVKVTGQKTGFTTITKTSDALSTVQKNDWSHSSGLSVGSSSLCSNSDVGTVQCTSNSSSSTTVSASSNSIDTSKLSISDNHSCELFSGSIKCWGDNTYGQLGNGTTTSSSTAVVVTGISTATKVAVGDQHSCALLSTGSIKCWGNNSGGTLGGYVGASSSTPQSVSGITTATGLSVGDNSSCALLADATVKCWGWNHYGQLGNGTSGGTSATPVVVSGLSSVTKIEVGGLHACAVLTTRQVKCWGSNMYGQLGASTPSSSTTPMSLGAVTLSTDSILSLGYGHTCLVDSANVPKCTGLNSNGQIGNGTTTNATSLTTVTGLTNVASLRLGDYFSAAVLSDGTVYTWGENYYANLADGTTTGRTRPTIASQLGQPISPIGQVSFSASPQIGTTVTGLFTGWANDATMTLQWYSGGKVLSGENSASHVVTASDSGKSLHLLATVSQPGKNTKEFIYSAGTVSISTFSPSVTPEIIGASIPGSTLSVPDLGLPAGTQLTYEWLRDGWTINGATGASYGPLASDVGSQIGLKLTATKSGYVTRVFKLQASTLVTENLATVSPYNAISPKRLVDTRAGQSTIDGQDVSSGYLGPGETIRVEVLGRAGVPLTGVSAVALNVTVVSPSASGWLTVFPTGEAVPQASNLNFSPGAVIPNMVISKVGNDGSISITNPQGNTNIIVDIAGWFPTQGAITPLTPARLLDTRGYGTVDGQNTFGKVAQGGQVVVPITGRAGVPNSGVAAVALNVTVVEPTASGWLTVYPTGESIPTASNLNFTAGTVIPNMVIAKVGANGSISISNPVGATHILVDIAGWFPTGGALTPLSPARILDTRGPTSTIIDSIRTQDYALWPGEIITIPVAGRAGVPATGAGSVALNVTVVSPTGSGWLTVFPSGESVPNASNLNFSPGAVIPNMVIAKLGSDGKISISNPIGYTHILIDVAGWFPP